MGWLVTPATGTNQTHTWGPQGKCQFATFALHCRRFVRRFPGRRRGIEAGRIHVCPATRLDTSLMYTFPAPSRCCPPTPDCMGVQEPLRALGKSQCSPNPEDATVLPIAPPQPSITSRVTELESRLQLLASFCVVFSSQRPLVNPSICSPYQTLGSAINSVREHQEPPSSTVI